MPLWVAVVIRKLLALVGIGFAITGNGGGCWLHLRLCGWYTPGIKLDWLHGLWALVALLGIVLIAVCVWNAVHPITLGLP